MKSLGLLGTAMLVFVCGGSLSTAGAQHREVVSCAQTGRPEPGIGHAFTNDIRNEDYNFSAAVPLGLTGWTGVGDSAPFHGFTIFMGRGADRCIVFELHLRVDRTDESKMPPNGAPIVLGAAKGWRAATDGTANGVHLINVKTNFSNFRADQIDDGSVLLVTTPAHSVEDVRSYDAFLKRLKFGP